VKLTLISTHDVKSVCLFSCEQSSSQPKSDPLPNITKKFKRYQHEKAADDGESTAPKKREKSVTRGSRENAPVRKQTKSSSSVVESQKQSATTAHNDDDSAPEQHSDAPVCTGK